MSNQLIQFLNPYSKTVNLPSISGSVEIKSITTGQMKKILSYEDNDDPFIIEDILDDIIKGCVTTEGFNIDNLTIQDRFLLLIEIRKITKGNKYTFNIDCPECKTELIKNIDQDKLNIKSYPDNIDTRIKITDALSAHLTFITRGMQKQATNIVRNNKSLNNDQQMAEMATYLYASAITAFDTPAGEITDSTIEDKKELLDNLSETSYQSINDWFDKYDYGIEFKFKPSCRFCGWEGKEEDIPVSGFFF
jgi:predicted Zn-ribbon and HTH transcriptional regulator